MVAVRAKSVSGVGVEVGFSGVSVSTASEALVLVGSIVWSTAFSIAEPERAVAV